LIRNDEKNPHAKKTRGQSGHLWTHLLKNSNTLILKGYRNDYTHAAMLKVSNALQTERVSHHKAHRNHQISPAKNTFPAVQKMPRG
jgi:hypothetical protein